MKCIGSGEGLLLARVGEWGKIIPGISKTHTGNGV